VFASLELLGRSSRHGKAPRRVKSSVEQHITHDAHHIAGNSISVRIICRWDDNPSSEDSVENGKCSFEVVAFGQDIIHPFRKRNLDIAKLCSSVKQKLGTFMVIVRDGISKSSTSIITHDVKLSAGTDEDLT
jgi:hypothetical protein